MYSYILPFLISESITAGLPRSWLLALIFLELLLVKDEDLFLVYRLLVTVPASFVLFFSNVISWYSFYLDDNFLEI